MLSVNAGPTAVLQGEPALSGHEHSEPQDTGALFVAALTRDSDSSWLSLLDRLTSLPPSKLRELALQPHSQHYIHRAVQHAAKHWDRLAHLRITETLASLFPEEVEVYENQKLPFSYSYSDLEATTASSRQSHADLKKRNRRAVTVDSATPTKDLFTYSRDRVPATYRAPVLKLGDLAVAAGEVSREITSTEKKSIHLQPSLRSTTPHAPGSPKRGPPFLPGDEPEKAHIERPFLQPVLESELDESWKHRLSHGPGPSPSEKTGPLRAQFQQRTARVKKSLGSPEQKPQTAYDIIEAFATGRLKSGAEAVYLNYRDSVPWNPYSLLVVPKTRIDREHFIISKFGVLHIYPDGESDLQSFADWLKEAGLFTLVSQIPFFRLYLLRKGFARWYRNVRYNQFARIHSQISRTGLRFFPNFAEGLLKIQSLSQELLAVPFHSVQPLGGYTPEAFETTLQGSRAKAQRLLQRYFRYCRRVVAEVVEVSQSRALELETEKRHQPFVSELPISIQKERHVKLEKDLQVAQYRAGRLGEFVTLANQMVTTCLTQWARQSAQSWVDTTLGGIAGPAPSTPAVGAPPSKPLPLEGGGGESVGSGVELTADGLGEGVCAALLCAELTFGESGTLTTSPSTTDLESSLLGPLHTLTHTLTSTTQPLTGTNTSATLEGPRASSRPSGELSPSPSTLQPDNPSPNASRVKEPQTKTKEVSVKGVEPRPWGVPSQQPKSLLRVLKGITSSGQERQLESVRARDRLCQVAEGGDEGVEGWGVEQGTSPLLREELRQRLERDEVLVACLTKLQSAVGVACREAGSLCRRLGWLEEMWHFVQQWGGRGRAASLSPEEFQATLSQLHEWAGSLARLPPQLPTPHSLVGVATGALVGVALPRLQSILGQLKATGVEHARGVCRRVLQQATRHTEALSSKRYDLEGFAAYSKQLRECQTFHHGEAPNVHYVLRVHSILLHHGVEVPPEDKALGRELQLAWGALEERLAEAKEFVETQTPVKAQGLQASITSCEDELRKIVDQVNEGDFVVPEAPPTQLLERLKGLQEEAFAVRARLLGLSKWKEAITGRSHDLSSIASLLEVLFVRQELWKYCRVFANYEKDWLKIPFKKLDMSVLSQKVGEWLAVCSRLQKSLPPQDPVLEEWKGRLDKLQGRIPLLMQLSSKALRTSHWCTIFATLGEDYDPSVSYTLNNFSLYNIYKHSDIIFEICHDAMQEDRLRVQLSELQKQWESLTLSTVQTPLEHFPFAVEAPRDRGPSPSPSPSPRRPRDKTTTFAIGLSQPSSQTVAESLLSVARPEEVSLLLEDSECQLKVLLASAHVGSLRGRAQALLATLRQLGELLGLITTCQARWQDLLQLFSQMGPALRPSCGLPLLQQATGKFQEVSHSIHNDPRVLSLLGKRRGQKGFRELQGDALRQSLGGILNTMESVVSVLGGRLEEACCQFPRLFYLPDHDIIRVLSHRGSPLTLIPLISRVFPSVVSVRFTEVMPSSSPAQHMGSSSSDEGFQITGVEGSEGEPLPLLVPLPLGKRLAPVWLQALEGALRYSLACGVSECRETLPETLMGISSDDQAEFLQQWLGSHPQQTVLLALELHWTSVLSSALSSVEPGSQLKQASSKLLTAVDSAVGLLRTLHSAPGGQQQKTALQNIIITLRHKMDTVKSLTESGDISLDSFTWKRHIHYSVEGEPAASHASESESTSKRTSFRSSMASLRSMASSKPASPSVKPSRNSLEQGSSALSHRLLGSAHSLVASSKSLLSSKQSLLANELPTAGSSSLLPTKCVVHSGESTLPYGFEYYSGSGSKLVLTPATEACLLQLLSAVAGYTFPCVSGGPLTGKTETATEAAKLLGRHYYLFNCSPWTTTPTLTRLLAGALRVGSLLVLFTPLSLPVLVMAALGQLLDILRGTLAEVFVAGVESRQDQDTTGTLPTSPTSSRSPSPFPSPSPRPLTSTVHSSTRIDWYRNETSAQWLSHEGSTASAEFAGQSISISSSFGCVLVDRTPIGDRADVPDQLKASLRPIPLVPPGVQLVAEVLLLSRGFSEALSISTRLACLIQHLHTQLSIASTSCFSGLQTLKRVVAHAADHLGGSPKPGGGDDGGAYGDGEFQDMECLAVAQGVMMTFASVSLEDSRKLRELVDSYFPRPEAQTQLSPSPSPLGADPELQRAILSQLEERHLQDLPALVEKIQQLHTSLLHHRWVTLVGPRGSGKTTALRILAASYRHFRELQALGRKGSRAGEYPDVDITVINPGVYSWDELFGSYQGTAGGKQWKDGILTRLMRQTEGSDHLKASHNHPDSGTVAQEQSPTAGRRHWLVLDGPVGAGLAESLASLVTPHGICLPNGEKLLLPASLQLLVETSSLAPLAPSFLTQSALVHFSGEVLTWEALVDTWLDHAPTLHNLSAMSTETLALMLKQLVPEALDFLQHTNASHHGASHTSQLRGRASGILETRCFLNLLSATLERNAPKMESSLYYPSRSSCLSSSQLSGSRAGSSVGHSFSFTSVPDSRGMSRQASTVDMGGVLEPLGPEDEEGEEEGLSECSLELGPTLQMQKASILAFAYIWSMGAFVPFSELATFDTFAREQIGLLPYQVPLPEEGSVFDYWLDLRHYRFLTWAERSQGKSSRSMSGGYVILPDLERIAYVLDLYLSYGHGVLLVGEQGSGKSSFVEHLIQSRMPVTQVPITHTLTPSQLQQTMLDKLAQLEKRAGQKLGPGKKAAAEKCLFFMDDLHLASRASSSCSSRADTAAPILEALRFAASQEVLFDLSRNYRHHLHSVRYIGSCTPQGFSQVVPSLGGLLNPLPFLPLSDEALQQVFSRSTLLWLQQFPAASIGDPEFLAEAIAAASVTVYRSVSRKLCPSPAQPYLLFTMHDLLHVYEGLLLMSPDTKAQAQPQFGLLNRRGFLSSTSSSKGSRKGKASGKTKSGKHSSLPSLRGKGRDVSVQSGMRAKMRALSVPGDSESTEEQVTTLRMLCRLWCHENTRVYADRLGDSRDRMWFLRLLEACIKCCFCGVNLQAPPTAPRQPLGGYTATKGGRRGRGGRGRTNVLPPSEGPSLADLASSGVSVDTLQRLVPRDPELGLRKLLPYDQLTMRGEDLTGLMFARFPKPGRGQGKGQTEESSLLEGEDEDNESESGKVTPAGKLEGYNELGDGQVTEALGPHLARLRDQTGRGDLVLFRGAIEHVTRLCRVMHIPGCHALLLGSKGTGRRSLTQLAAHVMEAQLFEVPATVQEGDHQALRAVLREVCVSAGLERRTTALLVGRAQLLGKRGWESVLQLMSEGLCPGLFTSSELLVMSSRLPQQGKVKRTAPGAQQAFARAVQRSLHIFVAWDLQRGGAPFGVVNGATRWSLGDTTKSGFPLRCADELVLEEGQRAVFASLCHCCSHIDLYHPWSRQAFSDVALRWWQQAAQPQWQDWIDTGSQLEAVASLAAHIHLTSNEMLSQASTGLAVELLSPSSLMAALKMTQAIAMAMRTKEKAVAERLEAVLQKLGEVDHTVQALERQLEVLRPRLAAAEMEVQQRMGLITSAKERYMLANQRCKTAEETIETETTNVEQLSKIVKEKEEQVSPLYQSSLEALSAVEKNDVLEVMSYREPPATLTPVFDAMCMLFDRPKTWEDCKQLLLSQNFFESLKFFDRDNVPRKKLSQLEKMIVRGAPFEEVEHGSRAVVPLHQWMSALVDYHQAKRTVRPFQERLTSAESTLMEANKTFVLMRKNMMETKAAMEETVKLHRESVQGARSIEAEIEAVQAKVDQANRLLYALSRQRLRWEEQLRSTRGRMDSVPGHALLCAASACYLTRVPPDRHQKLLSNWLSYCSGGVGLGSLATPRQKGLQSSVSHQGMTGQQQQVVRIERKFSLQELLSSRDERTLWQQESVFPDQTTLERCLAVHTCCTHGSTHWPLVFDPNNQFCKYLQAVEARDPTENEEREAQVAKTHPEIGHSVHNERGSVLLLKSSQPGVSAQMSEAMAVGRAVALTLDSLPADEGPLLQCVMKRKYSVGSNSQLFLNREGYDPLPVNPDFRLYIILDHPLGSVKASRLLQSLGCDLSDFCVADMGLCGEGLRNHLLLFIVGLERPEYGVRHKSVLTDLTLHQQQADSSQEQIMQCVLDTDGSLLHSTSLVTTVRNCENSEASAMEQIAETKKILRSFDQQIQVYKPLAEYAASIFNTVQKLGSSFRCYQFSLTEFEQLIEDVVMSHKDLKVANNSMALKGHVLHLKKQLLLRVYNATQIHIFGRHQVLLPLLVALEAQVAEGKLMWEEYQLLGEEGCSVEAQMDVLLGGGGGSVVEKPQWVTNQCWCAVLQLQKQLPALRRLAVDIRDNSTEWREYFQLPPCLLAPVPGVGEALSLGQRLLLWKVFRENKFSEVVHDFILLTLGSEFTTSRSPSITAILPHTSPLTPTLCLLPDSNTPIFTCCSSESPATWLKDTAQACDRELQVYPVVDRAGLGDLLSLLPEEAAKKGWVAVEHCHLCSGWQEGLEALFQALADSPPDSVHPDFRLWVLLPVGVATGVEFNTPCLRVAFERDHSEAGAPDSLRGHSENSQRLLDDIKQVIGKPFTLQSQWETTAPLVSKILAFLPTPLGEEDLTALGVQDVQESGHSQSIFALLAGELLEHNKALITIHASLQTATNYFKGSVPFSSELGQLLSSIAHNRTPEQWAETLPFEIAQLELTDEFLALLKLLKSRVKFYTNCLHSGSLPPSFTPLWFSNPSDLLSRSLHGYINTCQLQGEEMVLQGKLMLVDSPDDQEQYGDPDCCLTLHGLTLHGAAWNTQKQCLELQSNIPDRTEDYSVLLSPMSREHSYSERAELHCPVLVAREPRGEPDLRASPLLHVCLEAESAMAVCGLEGRVYLTCHLSAVDIM